jgi:pimeloyl-ACP methyl ester carboxylesterase
MPIVFSASCRRHGRRFCSRVFGRGWILLCLTIVLGCASDDYLKVRKVPRNPLAGPLQLLSRDGPQATPRTTQLLRRFDLEELRKKKPAQSLAKLQQEVVQAPTTEKFYAVAELAYIDGKKAEALQHDDQALEMYAASVAHAYMYLFDPKTDPFRNPYDSQFRRACDVYNGALEAALRIVHKKGQLQPGVTETIPIGDQQYEITIAVRGSWKAEEIERLEFVSDYEIEGLNNRHHTFGLGVPLIAVRKQGASGTVAEEFYPPGLSFPVTAFLRVSDHPVTAAGGQNQNRSCVLELYDPLVATDIQVDGRRVPLETDLSTPLAYFLDQPALQESKAVATLGLLNPFGAESLKGLYMLEPYDENKIPVLMVHGLWSSPLTWMEMFNDLRSFPGVRDHYQFWFYLYPTGEPFWISARQLREDMNHMRDTLDPARQTGALDQMVVVGHSMGGLVSRLQVTDSGDDFWRILTDRPIDELEATAETRQRLAETFYFQPNTSIRRVITIGTPHRGSEFANDYTRWLGRSFIKMPPMIENFTNRVTRQNSGFFRDTQLLTTTTSIGSLSPDSPIIPVMLESNKAPWVTFHNIVGVVPPEGFLARFSGVGDGIVSYESAHMEDVATEDVVEADHVTVHQHPRSVLAVRNILLQHSTQVAIETGTEFGTRIASYDEPLPDSHSWPLPTSGSAAPRR